MLSAHRELNPASTRSMWYFPSRVDGLLASGRRRTASSTSHDGSRWHNDADVDLPGQRNSIVVHGSLPCLARGSIRRIATIKSSCGGLLLHTLQSGPWASIYALERCCHGIEKARISDLTAQCTLISKMPSVRGLVKHVCHHDVLQIYSIYLRWTKHPHSHQTIPNSTTTQFQSSNDSQFTNLTDKSPNRHHHYEHQPVRRTNRRCCRR
jgi:hypothetical protein